MSLRPIPPLKKERRGIRSFETAQRNTYDITAILALNELTHLPTFSIPAMPLGSGSLVPALARAGVAIGAPEKAISDAQSLDLEKFDSMMRDLRPYLELWAASRKGEASPPSAE